ncbi:hypothetical protein J6590_032713, partial [Homalodisca vitripennis]
MLQIKDQSSPPEKKTSSRQECFPFIFGRLKETNRKAKTSMKSIQAFVFLSNFTR